MVKATGAMLDTLIAQLEADVGKGRATSSNQTGPNESGAAMLDDLIASLEKSCSGYTTSTSQSGQAPKPPQKQKQHQKQKQKGGVKSKQPVPPPRSKAKAAAADPNQPEITKLEVLALALACLDLSCIIASFCSPSTVESRSHHKGLAPPRCRHVGFGDSIIFLCILHSNGRLFCEEIDVGEAEPRQIASGLRPYYTLEQMQVRNSFVLTISCTNKQFLVNENRGNAF
jgi:tRNA-binding EMAP/Myf-like protein